MPIVEYMYFPYPIGLKQKWNQILNYTSSLSQAPNCTFLLKRILDILINISLNYLYIEKILKSLCVYVYTSGYISTLTKEKKSMSIISILYFSIIYHIDIFLLLYKYVFSFRPILIENHNFFFSNWRMDTFWTSYISSS